MATVAVIGIWVGEGDLQRSKIAFVVGTLVGIVVVWRTKNGPGRTHFVFLIALIAFGVGHARSASEWRAVTEARFEQHNGEATVVGDSKAVGKGRRVIFEIEGQRFESWVFGSKRHRVKSLDSGDVVLVEGVRMILDQGRERRFHIRHIVGRFEVTSISTAVDGENRSSALMRAANRVRAAIREGAGHVREDRATLFTGLVYGDDSEQSPEMVARFRASGLAHLTAVSGQNVVFVLGMFAPILTRLRRPTRVALTIMILGWFAIMTRLEPSVVRAVFMAGVSTAMVALGRPVSSWIALCLTVCLATMVDPFLVWSVGWWLSVSGCIGLIVATPLISRTLGRYPRWVASWLAPTIAAQTGVLGVIVAVFGWPSAVSIPSNLLAAPVAGAVMLLGLPISILAGRLPDAVSVVLMWPVGLAVAWVDGVATLGARMDPPGAVDVAVAVTSVAVVVGTLIARASTNSHRSVDLGDPARTPSL